MDTHNIDLSGAHNWALIHLRELLERVAIVLSRVTIYPTLREEVRACLVVLRERQAFPPEEEIAQHIVVLLKIAELRLYELSSVPGLADAADYNEIHAIALALGAPYLIHRIDSESVDAPDDASDDSEPDEDTQPITYDSEDEETPDDEGFSPAASPDEDGTAEFDLPFSVFDGRLIPSAEAPQGTDEQTGDIFERDWQPPI